MERSENQNIGFLDIVWRYKFRLAFFIVLISFISFTFLYIIGGVPDELKVLDNNSAPVDLNAPASVPSTAPIATGTKIFKSTVSPLVQDIQGDLPIRIMISKIGVDTSVSNPSSDNLNVLNAALLHGAVRYPGSGTLGQGNLFIFGHSTGIRIVNNQAFKTFDHLDHLNIGDEIIVDSGTMEYIYKVTSVSLVDDNQALVDFTQKKNMLTISTCNVFGEEQQRFVVEAVFDSSREK